MIRKLLGLMGLLLVLVACTGAKEGLDQEVILIATPEGDEQQVVELTDEPLPTATATTAAIEIEHIDDRPDWLASVTQNWNTNWNKHTIDYGELLAGGPPRDGIPSIDKPIFISQDEASEWLAENEPVVVLEINGDARAYPLQIITWHEIVNDTVGEVPVVVTFCPLCNSAVAFERQFDGIVSEFGVSGLLRNSDLVMYDRVTESLWQQLTGDAIVGEMTGAQLTFVPASLVSLADFGAAYPDGVVLSRETGYTRSYGRNPYAGYDNISQNPFLFDGIPDDRLPAMERVVAVSLNGVDVAYPYSVLSQLGVINDNLGGQKLVVFHAFGTSSALGEAFIAEGKDIGATGVFDPILDGRELTFVYQDGRIEDKETGSTWDILGQAVSGPLAGEWLTPIVHGDHFWFAWAAFKLDTVLYQAE